MVTTELNIPHESYHKLSAADDMYRALKAVTEYVDNFGEPHITEMVKNAIAKAEGRRS